MFPGYTGDTLNLEVKMTRHDMGASILMHRPPGLIKVPFTLGPLKGTAHVTNGNSINYTDGLLSLEFDMELFTEGEKITLADALVAFFGAEKSE